MRPLRTPFEVGLSDGEFGRYKVPREYTQEQKEEYQRGYDKGYEYYRQKLYESKATRSNYYGPYLDESWIPKDGKYS